MWVPAKVGASQRAGSIPAGQNMPERQEEKADGEGFEPPVGEPTPVFKTGALNQTQPSVQIADFERAAHAVDETKLYQKPPTLKRAIRFAVRFGISRQPDPDWP